MKIVWICNFSNAEIRSRIHKKNSILEPLALKMVHRTKEQENDYGIWITNGIQEIKHRNDVELHVITPIRNLSEQIQEEHIDGIYYHFIRDENSSLLKKIVRFFFTRNKAKFKINRKRILCVIRDINPDLVHVIGAENPFYSLVLLDIPKRIPTFLQLQALLCSLENKIIDKGVAKNYLYKGEIEKELIRKSDYIGTIVPGFIKFIRENINPNARILNTTLAMSQEINLKPCQKKYTFVHFAAFLGETKATDIAIEAFCIVHKSFPDITLDVIGAYDIVFKQKMDEVLEKNGALENVIFEGRLTTHADVLNQIRMASYALLPLKIDVIPNTLHEAMANGLPVLTTETEGGTPRLNENRCSVLISPIGDVVSLANNMIELLKNPKLAAELRENAATTEMERVNNKDIMSHWVKVYEAIIRNTKIGKDIPSEFYS